MRLAGTPFTCWTNYRRLLREATARNVRSAFEGQHSDLRPEEVAELAQLWAVVMKRSDVPKEIATIEIFGGVYPLFECARCPCDCPRATMARRRQTAIEWPAN
jgi:hypothetical protein